MSTRVIEVSKPSWLRHQHKSLIIEQDQVEVGKVPVEDIAMLILDSFGIVITSELIDALMEAGVALVHCDAKHMPHAFTLSQVGHHQQAKILREQIAATEPTKKRLWQQIIQGKIANQASCVRLARRGQSIRRSQEIRSLVSKVLSGDTSNLEARAARLSFEALFGSDFVRDRDEEGINSALNYGYAVMRALVARSIVATGLNCTLGIHHQNQYNPYALADDLMEPLRPMVDLAVYQLSQRDELIDGITPGVKRALLQVLVQPVEFAGKQLVPPLAVPLYVAHCKQVLCGERRKLTVPAFTS